MIPSSDQIASASRPKRSRMRADSASAQAAWTRPPKGESTHSRQSPISSRKRSTTIVRSDGSTPVAACCSRRYSSRLRAARAVEVVVALRASRPSWSTAQRENAPIASPSSFGRPTASPFQNGTAPGAPGRRRDDHAVAADLLDPPGGRAEQERLARARLVDHLLVELADAAAVGQRDREQAAVGDRAGVGDGELRAPLRARIVPATRSQTIRGRSSPNSLEG